MAQSTFPKPVDQEIKDLNSKTMFSTLPSSDSSSLSDDAAIALKAFQAAPENSSGFRCQDSTGVVRYCIVFKRVSGGGVILVAPNGAFKYFTISNGAVVTYQSYDIGALNSNIATKTGTITFAENVNGNHVSLQKSGNLIALIGYVTITSEMDGNAQLFTLPTGFRPTDNQYAMAYADNYNSNKTTDILFIRANGICSGMFGSSKNFGANSHVFFNVTFCC